MSSADLLRQASELEAKGLTVQGLKCREDALLQLSSQGYDTSTLFEDYMKRSNMMALSLMQSHKFDDSFTLLSACDNISRSADICVDEHLRNELRATTLNNLGLFYQMRGEPVAALASLKAACAMMEDAKTLLSISNAYYAMGDMKRATEYSGRSIAIAEMETASLDGKSLGVLQCALHSHGIQQEALKNFREAVDSYIRSYYILRTENGESSAKTNTARSHLTRCLEKAKREGIVIPAHIKNCGGFLHPTAPQRPRTAAAPTQHRPLSGTARPAPPQTPKTSARPTSATKPQQGRKASPPVRAAPSLYGPPTRPSTARTRVQQQGPKAASDEAHYGLPNWVFRGMSDSGREAYNHLSSQVRAKVRNFPPIEEMPDAVRYPQRVAVSEPGREQSSTATNRPPSNLSKHTDVPSKPSVSPQCRDSFIIRRHGQAQESLAGVLQSIFRAKLSVKMYQENLQNVIRKKQALEDMIQKVREEEVAKLHIKLEEEIARRQAPLEAQLLFLRTQHEAAVKENQGLSRELEAKASEVNTLQETKADHETMRMRATEVLQHLQTLAYDVTHWKSTSVAEAQRALTENIRRRNAAFLIQRRWRRFTATIHLYQLQKEKEKRDMEEFLVRFSSNKKLRFQQHIRRVLTSLLHRVRARLQWAKSRDFNLRVLILQRMVRHRSSAKYVRSCNVSRLLGDLNTVQRIGRGFIRRVCFARELIVYHRELAVKTTLSAMNIQRVYRSFLEKRKYKRIVADRNRELHERKINYAAKRLTAWWRGWCVFSKTHDIILQNRRERIAHEAEQKRSAEREAMVKRANQVIQRTVRSYLARRFFSYLTQIRLRKAVNYLQTEGQKNAVYILGRFRRIVKAKAEVRRRRQAHAEIEELKAWYRKREDERVEEEARLAVTIRQVVRIQSVWRSYGQRRKIQSRKEQQVASWERYRTRMAVCIQASWRGFLGRQYAKLRRREVAVAQEPSDAKRKVLEMVLRIHRGYLERIALRKAHVAAPFVSLATFREQPKSVALNVCMEIELAEAQARFVITNTETAQFFEIVFAKAHDLNTLLQPVRLFLRQASAARTISATAFGAIARLQVAFERRRVQSIARANSALTVSIARTSDMAAMRIQCLYRSFASRRMVKKLRESVPQCSGAITAFDRVIGAAEDIQRVWRGFWTRSELVRTKRVGSSRWDTEPPLSPFRKPRSPLDFALEEIEIIQRAWRSYMARKMLAQMQRLVQFSLHIESVQALGKGFLARKLLAQKRAATLIQSTWRGAVCRKQFHERQQTWSEMYQDRVAEEASLHATEKSFVEDLLPPTS